MISTLQAMLSVIQTSEANTNVSALHAVLSVLQLFFNGVFVQLGRDKAVATARET